MQVLVNRMGKVEENTDKVEGLDDSKTMRNVRKTFQESPRCCLQSPSSTRDVLARIQ